MTIPRKCRRASVSASGRVLLAFAAAAALIGCGQSKSPGAAQTAAAASEASPPAATPRAPEGVVVFPADSPQLKQIAIEPAREVAVAGDEITAPAKVEVNPNRVAHALLPVPGRIARVLVKLGDAVVQGQPVASVESPSIGEAESGYVQAEQAVRQAELTVAKAEADLSRSQVLFDHGAIASKELLAAQIAAAVAKSSLDQARATQQQARQRLELLGLKPDLSQQQATVTAPVSGKVLEINVVAGEYHNEVNASLLTIADLSRVWVSSDVPESEIRFCRIGGFAELQLIAYPNETFRARITRIADTVEPETRTIKVTAELDNPSGRLRPQSFGRMRYAGVPVKNVWVPESAVVQVGDKNTVFVEQGSGRFAAIAVELGRRHDSGFVVRHGLAAGQRIVTTGAVYIRAGL